MTDSILKIENRHKNITSYSESRIRSAIKNIINIISIVHNTENVEFTSDNTIFEEQWAFLWKFFYRNLQALGRNQNNKNFKKMLELGYITIFTWFCLHPIQEIKDVSRRRGQWAVFLEREDDGKIACRTNFDYRFTQSQLIFQASRKLGHN